VALWLIPVYPVWIYVGGGFYGCKKFKVKGGLNEACFQPQAPRSMLLALNNLTPET